MHMNIFEVSSHLIEENGIYRSKYKSPISYPADGNKNCFLLEDNSFWFGHRNKCITSVIKHFPPNGPVLDVGGGNGYVSRGIIDAGYDAILLEPGSQGAINGKRARGIPTVICSTLQDANFHNSSISAVGCFDVIEHVENDKKFIKDIHKILESGGVLYATVPAHKFLWSQSDVNSQHYRRYNKILIEELLENKFEILYFTYFFSLLTFPILLFRAIPYRLGLSKKMNILSKNTEHGTNNGVNVKVMNRVLKSELNKIKNKQNINFGASCLFVARKMES